MADAWRVERSFDGQARAASAKGRPDRLLAWRQVQEIAGISRSTAWRMQKAGDFPEPVPISPNRVGWLESDLTAWKAARLAADAASPRRYAPPRAPKLIKTARSPKPAVDHPVGPAKGPPAVRPPAAAPAAGPPIPVAVEPPVQGVLPLEPAKPSPAPPVRKRARKRHVSPDQTDFGF